MAKLIKLGYCTIIIRSEPEENILFGKKIYIFISCFFLVSLVLFLRTWTYDLLELFSIWHSHVLFCKQTVAGFNAVIFFNVPYLSGHCFSDHQSLELTLIRFLSLLPFQLSRLYILFHHCDHSPCFLRYWNGFPFWCFAVLIHVYRANKSGCFQCFKTLQQGLKMPIQTQRYPAVRGGFHADTHLSPPLPTLCSSCNELLIVRPKGRTLCYKLHVLFKYPHHCPALLIPILHGWLMSSLKYQEVVLLMHSELTSTTQHWLLEDGCPH